jgi:hypothetical protein
MYSLQFGALGRFGVVADGDHRDESSACVTTPYPTDVVGLHYRRA